MNTITISNRVIGKGQPCFIIAEAGVNHNGDVTLAKKLIDIARENGADAVKFQTFHADTIVTTTAEKAGYQKNSTQSDESQYDMIKKLEFPDSVFLELSQHAKNQGIIFLSTPFDERSVDLLDQIGVPAFKISSGEITNFPLLRKIAEKKKPVILSTGMATLGEVEDAFHYLKKCNTKDILLLHCTTSYPAPIHAVNLRAMETLHCAFHVPVGLSDHTEGITIPIAAVAMGACVLEKHFTVNRTLPGPDHAASLEPHELQAMIEAIRNVEYAMGDGVKGICEEEKAIKEVVRKSIVATYDIPAGTILTQESLTIKRPGNGIEPKYYESMLNKKTRFDISKDQVIDWNMVE